MKLLTMDRALTRRRILRANVFLGISVFFIAFAVNVMGTYNNLEELKAADTMFNYFAIGGLMYSVVSLMFCVISKPFWFPK